MNKIALALLLLSTNTFAGEHEHGRSSNVQLQLQGQAQAQAQAQSQTGSTLVSETSNNNPRIAPSAIAPSVSQNAECPIVSPASKAGSVFFFSGSGTTGQTINGICVAVYLGEIDIVRKIACSNNREYHEANPLGCK